MVKKFFLTLVLVLALFSSHKVYAQEDEFSQPPAAPTPSVNYEARVTKISEEKEIEFDGKKQLYQKLELQITSENDKGKTIMIENGNLPSATIKRFNIGDRVLINKDQTPDGSEIYFITDYIRRSSLLWLFVIFLGLTLLVGRTRGLMSVVGMCVSFLVIFYFILPRILAGNDPSFITILASVFLIPVTFYLSHGFNKKTTAAVLGTIASLVVTGVLAHYFVNDANLTGFASEEAGFLQTFTQGAVNVQGLILAGIIIGLLGVLDDITISQAAVVSELKKASDKLSTWDLYKRAMEVGKDHIASSVNTLVLVYAGVALPLLLLFVNNPHPFTEVINYEIVAEEVVRTLVASIGLILAVPITTIISALWISD